MQEIMSDCISIVIPAYNEAESLPELIGALTAVMTPLGRAYEVWVVDDGSTDATMETLRRLRGEYDALRVIRCRRNFGKSSALNVGFRSIKGRIVITLDADMQDDPAEIPKLLARLEEGADLVVGWKQDRQDSWLKCASSRLFNRITALVSGLSLHDFNCGLKAFRREVVDALALYGEMHRYIPALAHWKGFAVTEIPVRHEARRYGCSKFGPERFLRGFFDLLTVAFLTKYAGRPMHFFGKLGVAQILIGLGICLHLTIIKLRGGFIAFRPLLSLGVLMLILGVLFLSTGFLGEMIVYLFRNRNREIAAHIIKEELGPHD
ncbi:MAG: glycosyltransferase [Spartobacteria bacterium]|nr:glycosyltransferase [Spartobacteria bacterium]